MADGRVRFAPSPTGTLHLGNARTALFNFLLSRAEGYTFIYRSEDTDRQRSTRDSEQSIIEDLRWLGLEWDEGPDLGGPCEPYRQSEAGDYYRGVLERLQDDDKVYPCFCTPEQLDSDRQQQQANKENPGYVGRCRNLSSEQRQQHEERGDPHVWRLRIPESGTVDFDDIVRGKVSFPVGNLGGDLILARRDLSPTFHFAVVADDHRMKISLVLRGEDHLTNTAKQLLLYRALEWAPPRYGHMAMILGPDKAKLSKRHGDTSVQQYRARGAVPGALLNYLSLLGWNPGDDRELMELDEILSSFSLDRLVKSAAVFDEKKLAWMNGQYLRQMVPGNFVQFSRQWLESYHPELIERIGDRWIEAVLPLFQEKVEFLDELPGHLEIFVDGPVAYGKSEEKIARMESAKPIARVLIDACDDVPSGLSARLDWFERTKERAASESGATGKQLFQPLRLGASGRAGGPDLAQLYALMAPELIKARSRYLLEYAGGEDEATE